MEETARLYNASPFISNSTATDSVTSVWTPEVVTRVATVVVLMVATLVGNITLIAGITYKRSRLIRRVNVFLVNLAVGDLAVACITMTTEILFVAFGEWVLGPVVCKISVYLQIVTLASTTFLLTAMSIDRYQVIVKPLQSLGQRPKIWTKVVAAWIMAFTFAIPQLLIFVQIETRKQYGSTQRACVSRGYTEEWQRKLYFSFLTAYILLIPAGVMLYCYTKIIEVVWSRVDKNGEPREGRETYSPRMSINRSLVSASKRRAVIMTLTVIIGFLTCLTPYFTITLIRIYSDYSITMKEALPIAEAIFMMHSALNPILYGLFSLQPKHFRLLFRRRRKCNEQQKDCGYKSDRRRNQSNGCSHLRGRLVLWNGKKPITRPVILHENGTHEKTAFFGNEFVSKSNKNSSSGAHHSRPTSYGTEEFHG